MLELTADIADELLKIKDSGRDDLPTDLKLNIISLAEIASGTPDSAPVTEAAPESVPDPEPIPEPEPVREEDIIQTAEPVALTDEVADTTAAEVAASAEFEEEEDADINAEPESIGLPTPGPLPDPATEAATESQPTSATAMSTESQTQPESHPQAESQPQPEKKAFRIAPAALRQAFSINDAFLFRREIFGGSKESFDEALAHMANLNSRRALQEYLVEDLGLNLNESPGREFYDTLEVFF